MKHSIFIFALLLTALFAACVGKDHMTVTPIAGKGGGAQLLVYPAHHGITKNLANMIIYIKYNTSDAPPTTDTSTGATHLYDDSVYCVNNGGVPFGTFDSLKKGSYYLYGYGFDNSIPQRVHGGSSYTITSETSQNVSLGVSEY